MSRTIKVDYLARVEGEGSLYLKIDGDTLRDVRLGIFEPPRFFEAFLRGRKYTEAPDITARICGICPVAYQMSSVHAMEQALGVRVDGPLRELRRLLYCGEWIESHVLHAVMLHLPDFLGHPDAVSLAKDRPDLVKAGLALKKTGNALVTALAGREIHPINVRVGGFYKTPHREQLEALRGDLETGLETAIGLVRTFAGLEYPDFEQDYTFVSIGPEDEYPFNEGPIVASDGLRIPNSGFLDHFQEEHVERSNALHGRRRDGSTYLVGPLARYANHFDRLTPRAKEAARDAGLDPVVRNPFQSLLVRGVETVFAVEEALRILDAYEEPDTPFVEHGVHAGVGHGATEAPRGTLYHRYELDEQGIIQDAVIIPPTAQNQPRIEADLRAFVTPRTHLTDDELQWQCEQAIRNYDPCISCATHFLKLEVDRS